MMQHHDPLARLGRDITDWMLATDEPDDDLIEIIQRAVALQREMMESEQ